MKLKGNFFGKSRINLNKTKFFDKNFISIKIDIIIFFQIRFINSYNDRNYNKIFYNYIFYTFRIKRLDNIKSTF